MTYYNAYLYTDIVPFEVVRQVSDKTADIREMKTELVSGTLIEDPVWECKSDPEAPAIRVRLRKNGFWWDSRGWRYKQEPKPIKYNDPCF